MLNLTEFKKIFIFSLIGSLIISALIAVVTVLVGEFNEIFGRVLLTLLMVIMHSLVSLAFIWNDEKQNTFEKLGFFTNVLFILIVVSFFTSIFGIWQIIPGESIWRLYQTYFIIGLASLHGNILSKALHKRKHIDIIVYANYVFIAIVSLMLQPVIYISKSAVVLGEMFFRYLAAVSIIDGTLSILTVIFYKLHMREHPEIQDSLDQKSKKGLSIWIWILIIYLSLQITLPLMYSLFRFSFR